MFDSLSSEFLPSLPQHCDGLTAGRPWAADRAKHAAVAFLFLPAAEGKAEVILTRRTQSVRTHKGQIGFAGGRAEDSDDSPTVTAQRELEEELGVPTSMVSVHGELPPVQGLDGSLIVPVVMTAPQSVVFRAAPEEVAYVIRAPWTTLTRDKSSGFDFNLFGRWRFSHYFRVEQERVWGITARIIYQANLR